MSKISVLGAGNIGKFIGEYLAKTHDVTVYDNNQQVLGTVKAKTQQKDLSDSVSIINAVQESDIVINALPSFLGFKALKISIDQGKHVVDFSYMTEDPQQLDSLAKIRGVTAVVDFGFAPGMCHMFVGRALRLLKEVEASIIYVGGLPQKAEDEYKEVFSARDVLEEYSRPARSIKQGKIITEQPFERDIEWSKELPNGNIMSLSGFVSDGLRTMLKIKGVNNLVESTLRYHKHFKKMVGLKEDGFFKPENIEQTAKVLTTKWKRTPADHDMSILNVISLHKDQRIIDHFLYDEFDIKNGHHSMARVTGFPVIIMTEMILSGLMQKKGVLLPEELGQDDRVFEHVCDKLREHGITLIEKANETAHPGRVTGNTSVQ